MKILILTAGHSLRNLGDAAMLRVALTRVFEYYPKAEVLAFTTNPKGLLEIDPRATPFSPNGVRIWSHLNALSLPHEPFFVGLQKINSFLRGGANASVPLIAAFFKGIEASALAGRISNWVRFYEELVETNIVISSGGGFITDYFKGQANKALAVLEMAQGMGKPTAMFGQGIGPINNRKLKKLATKVLSNLTTLGLREGKHSPLVIESLGIPDKVFAVTGDDAIDFVLQERVETPREAIGVNLRLGNYAGQIHKKFHDIQQSISHLANTYSAKIVAVPTLQGDQDGDLKTIEQVFGPSLLSKAYDREILWDGDVIRLLGKCRILVTGSYHAGLFALTQGIPIIAISCSPYYYAKFDGLAAQFGSGCEIIKCESSDFQGRVIESASKAWEGQPFLESKLVEEALKQADISRAIWKQFFEAATE